MRSDTSAATTEAKSVTLLPGGKKTPPRGLQAKIIAVAAAMEPLVKRDTNPDGGWKFVSIDDYYEKAASKLLAAGVSWVAVEESFQDLDNLPRWRFRFDVFDAEGNWWEGAGRVTVPHEFEGPQTAGKVVSYAEKVFLRQLLKLVTGEPDADVSSAKRRDKGSASRGEPAVRIDKVRAPDVERDKIAGGENDATDKHMASDYGALEDMVNRATSLSQLNLVIETNKRMVSRAMRDDPEVYEKLARARTKKLKEFEDV